MKLRLHSLPTRRFAPVACLLLGGVSLQAAQVLYSTDFESPTFLPGSQLLGTDGWSTAIPPFLNAAAATIVAGQSVQVRGADLTTAPEVSPFAAVGSYRRPLNYIASGELSTVRIAADVRLDGLVGTGDFFTANLAARTGDGFAGELSVSSDGFVYGYNGTGDDNRLFTTPITLNAWHTLEIFVNFAANTYTFGVDGLLSAAIPFETGFVSDELVRESLVVYARPDTGTALKNNYTAYFDNVSATAIPEPSGAALVLFSGICLGYLRRRRS